MSVRVFNLIITPEYQSVIIKLTFFTQHNNSDTSTSNLVRNYYLPSLLHDLIAENEIRRVAPPTKYQQNDTPDSSRTPLNYKRPDEGTSGLFSSESCTEEPAGASVGQLVVLHAELTDDTLSASPSASWD